MTHEEEIRQIIAGLEVRLASSEQLVAVQAEKLREYRAGIAERDREIVRLRKGGKVAATGPKNYITT